MFHMNLFQHLYNSGEKYTFIDNQQPKQIDFREPIEIRTCLYIYWLFYSIILAWESVSCFTAFSVVTSRFCSATHTNLD